MINASTPVAVLMPTQAEIQLFMQALSACGMKRVTTFTSTSEAYEVCIRQQFPIFITRMEMPKMSGIVFIQKLRMTGNYGLEPNMLVCDKVDNKIVNVMAEYDLEYVLAAPFTVTTASQKIRHMIDQENNLSSGEAQYREAKTAFSNGLVDMAQDFIEEVLRATPTLEKALLLHGDMKASREDFDGARELYKSALKSNPKSSSAAHKLAQLFTKQGDHRAAADLLTKLAEISPYSIRLLENAGLSNFTAERYDDAKRIMGNLSGIDETNKTASTVTADIKIKTGDYDDLVKTLSKSHDEKSIIQFLNNAGAKLSKGDDIDGAIRMYSAVLSQITDSKYLYAIHYNMGLAYKKKQDAANAKMHFKRALKFNATFEKAIEELKKLSA